MGSCARQSGPDAGQIAAKPRLRRTSSGQALTLLIAAVLSLAATACAAAVAPDAGSGPPATTRVATTVTLGLGETATPSGLGAAVTLADVRDDSRCPAGTDCVWAGDATVTVDVAPDGRRARTMVLRLSSEDARTAEVGGLRIRLESLRPERQANTNIRRDEYRVTLSLSRP